MISSAESISIIVLIALVVYLTRAGGYFLGLQFRHIKRIQPVLEMLPGCAMMAILVPAARQGNLVELVGLSLVILIMWFTNNVALATASGIACLLVGAFFLQ